MPANQSATSLDPRVLDKLSSLALVARTVVEGFMAGQHRSPHRGSSIEFAQHRQYVPGDELRHVDWKIFARSNRLVVKEFIEETNFSCHLLVDGSESMGFKSVEWSKLDYARWCASALASLVIRQRDSAGLVLFDEDVRDKVSPKSGMHQLADITTALEEATPTGATKVGEVLQWIGTKLRRRGIVAIFSDFFDEVDSVVEAMRRLTHAGHEPILFQVLDPQELEFDYERLLRLDGLEGAGRVKVDPKSIRSAYKEEILRHNEELKKNARLLGVDFVPLTTSTPLDVALSTYLAHRTARARARS
ncbi:MAG: DUF58 domain-containing protein [Planctomycetota bacterium]